MSRPSVLLDTGPLVALLDRGEEHHHWAVGQFEDLPFPFLTCEAVLSEATHLVKRSGIGGAVVLDLVRTGAVRIDYAMHREIEALRTLIAGYSNVPMSLADACLVRMAERHRQASILTLDSDFHIYRRGRDEALSVIYPG